MKDTDAELSDNQGTLNEHEIIRKVYKQTCSSIDDLKSISSFSTIEVMDDLVNTRIILEELIEKHGICLHK